MGIVAHTEACDDKQRTDDLEEYLTVERELANIVADRRVNFRFGGGWQGENLTQLPVDVIEYHPSEKQRVDRITGQTSRMYTKTK